MKSLRRKPTTTIWSFLHEYGPWAVTAIGLILIYRGGTA